MDTFLDPSLVCRLCTIDLMQFPECYAIDEEMENLIYVLTSISLEDVEDKENNLMICISCYGRIKAFEDYRKKCIKNQEKFQTKQEIQEDPTTIETYMDPIEYVDESFDIQYQDDDQYIQSEQEIIESENEITEGVERIMDDGVEVIIEQLPIKSEEETSSHSKSRGKELYQRLLVKCELCHKMIERNRMEGHMNKHKNVRPFSCPECEKKFYCRQLLRLHRTSIHTNIRIKCETCDKSFPSQRALYAHSLRHKNQDKYECELCEKKFNNTNSLKRHLAVHSGVRDYICGTCGVGFYRKFNLDTHIKNVHDEIKNYVCNIEGCSKKFGYARLLRDHMRKCGYEKNNVNMTGDE